MTTVSVTRSRLKQFHSDKTLKSNATVFAASNFLAILFYMKLHKAFVGKRSKISGKLRACSHGGGGPQVGEVLRVGGVTNLSIQSLFFFLTAFT